MNKYKYFTHSEFDSSNEPGSGIKMDPKLIDKLDMIREACGFPLHVNSGVRTPEHNKKEGGKETSDHLIQMDGFAHGVDLDCTESWKRHEIIKAALKFGIRRIGIGKTFIHLGNWYQNPQDVTWLY